MSELTLAQRCLAGTATEWGSSRWGASFELVHACRAYTQLGGEDWNEVLREAMRGAGAAERFRALGQLRIAGCNPRL